MRKIFKMRTYRIGRWIRDNTTPCY